MVRHVLLTQSSSLEYLPRHGDTMGFKTTFGLNSEQSFTLKHVVCSSVFFLRFECVSNLTDQFRLPQLLLDSLIDSPSVSYIVLRSGSHMVRRAGVIPSMVPPTWPARRRRRGARCRGPPPQTGSRTKPTLPAGARTSPCLCDRSALGR